MRYVFAGVPEHEVRSMLGGTAAKVYGFDLDALAPVVARVGPPIDDVLRPLDDVPTGSLSSVFIPAVAERVRDAQRAGRV
jgi:hypothetical protein